MEAIKTYGYFFTAQGEPLKKKEFTIDPPEKDYAVIEVAGCGLCHTDIGYLQGHVRTNAALPLVLGHEISGRVVAAGSGFTQLEGKQVIIPSTMPCGECELCLNGRPNVCRRQKMPGNDFNGGFAAHISVPARFLCVLPDDLGKYELQQLSIVADAVTTPYQSLQRSNLKKGDLAIVIGTGGIGIYMLQLAASTGATVIALDIDNKKLDKAATMGASFTINSSGLSERDIKGQIRDMVKENKLPKNQWKVFETSGTGAGQSAAFSLLSFAGTLGVVGFTMEKVNIRLSNVMAFDADVFGNWGCKPEYYPKAAEMVLNGQINVLDNIEEHSLDEINNILPLAFEHKLENRVVFIP